MRREIPPHLLWPGMIVGLLLLGVVSTLWLVASAQSDGGVEAVAEYHRVDAAPEHAATQQASAALGWTIDGSASGRDVALVVRDRAGAPVTGLNGSVMVGRPQEATALDTVALRETAPGTYSVALDAPAPGLWDFTFDAVRGTAHFVGATRLALP